VPRRETGSGQGRRGRSRKFRTGALIAAAVGVAAATMVGMSASAVIAHASCTNRPTIVNLAVSLDIYPAIQTVARTFNREDQVAAGRCVDVQVTQGDPSTVAAQVDGQASLDGTSPVDAWIPDSSVWVDVARSYAAGAQAVQPTSITVARSPLVLVTSQAVAAQTGVFNAGANWSLLLPPGFGGPPASMGLSVDLPDPTDSAVGLLSVIEISRLLGQSTAGRQAFTKFEYTSASTDEFNSAAALDSFLQSIVLRKALAVSTEQAVVAFDRANPSHPLAAYYPTSASQATGSPELDYPYVLTSSSPAVSQGALAFGRFLEGSYAQSVIRYAGFRSASGVPDDLPASSGLSSQRLDGATPPEPTEVATNLSTWQKLGLGSRVLAILDDSAAMRAPSGLDGLTLEQVLTQTAARGLALFPASTEMGLWETPDGSSSATSYKTLVPVGPLPAAWGIFSRREEIAQIDLGVTPNDNPMHLNDTILAAYKQMTSTYTASYSNAIVLLTAGIDASGDMRLSRLLSQLKGLYNPAKKVEIVIIQFGRVGNFTAMQDIASATGGAAFQITNPDQIAQVFIEAISQRVCDQGCPAP
jgi:Ca-activated chloride channel homolog